MPLTQLMRKLSKRDSSRTSDSRATAEAIDMECDRSPAYGIMAEVVSYQDGWRSPCTSSLSNSSGASSSGQAMFHSTATSSALQQLRSNTAPPASSKLLTAGSLPSTSAIAGYQPATARVLRAKGKAALRGQSIDTDNNLDGTLVHVEQQQQQHQFPYGSHNNGGLHSIPYQRSATDPVSLWVATGSVSNSAERLLSLTSSKLSLQGNSSLAAVRTSVDGAHRPTEDDEDDDGEPLASPVSPGAASNAHLQDEEEHHCDWEDGVVGGWLAGFDPAELVNHEDDEGEHDVQHQQQQHQQQQQQQKVAGDAAGCGPERTASSMSAVASSDVVFSSLLYS